ncbi:MAG TPA: hypothetical protein VGA69_02010 [Nitriliruptorales bacterium]
MAVLNRADRDLLALHVWFAAIAALVLLVPLGLAVGVRIGGLVLLYNLAVPVMAVSRGHSEWLRVYTLVLPLSVLMVVPDWFLSSELGTLRFPPDGLVDVGTVTAYMAGLWTIPLFLTTMVGRNVEQRQGRGPAYVAAVMLGAVLFIGAEAFAHRVPMWEAVGVRTVNHVALYIVPAELALVVVVYAAYARLRASSMAVRAAAAVPIMVFYLGLAVTSWFLLEEARLTFT